MERTDWLKEFSEFLWKEIWVDLSEAASLYDNDVNLVETLRIKKFKKFVEFIDINREKIKEKNIDLEKIYINTLLKENWDLIWLEKEISEKLIKLFNLTSIDKIQLLNKFLIERVLEKWFKKTSVALTLYKIRNLKNHNLTFELIEDFLVNFHRFEIINTSDEAIEYFYKNN